MPRSPSDDYLRREIERLEQQRDAIDRELYVLRALQRERERLRSVENPRTVNSEMLSAQHRVALSKSRGTSRFLRHIRDKGFSLNSLAKAVGMSSAALSQAQRPKADGLSRPIREARAVTVEQLTGWPADEAHWPGGILKG